jgi:hypothetical protein
MMANEMALDICPDIAGCKISELIGDNHHASNTDEII